MRGSIRQHRRKDCSGFVLVLVLMTILLVAIVVGSFSSYSLGKTREKILLFIRANPQISTSEMAFSLGITQKGVEWQIQKLKSESVLKRIGPTKGGHWEILE